MPVIEVGHGLDSEREKRTIALDGLLRGILPVGQQGKTQVAASAREMMDLQPLDLLQQVGTIAQERRHDDERA